MSSLTPEASIGVVLVDDDTMALQCLMTYFATASDIRVLAATSSAHEALEVLRSRRVDVLVSDIQMNGMDGVAATAEALRVSPSTRVILLTSFDTDDYLIRGLEAGASGFLLKNAPAAEIVAAVRTVHAGAKVVAPGPTARLIDYALDAAHGADGSVELSAREGEVLELLCEGASNRQISSRLSISEATVKTYVSSLFRKTGTASRLEIVVWAFRHGYVHGAG
ncbi:response regulator transcription factor [Actinomyces howellii]|uniref:Response regulator protein vraR n=1 Tax=Actinomyces howellii TaxID=52771 RepID=A0A3S4RFY2_9ACTO|nr:response regulator transcription factor [Actinomyces howellii]VEG28626.1 Response regulator protein vraR [Actinomyces howellii]